MLEDFYEAGFRIYVIVRAVYPELVEACPTESFRRGSLTCTDTFYSTGMLQSLIKNAAQWFAVQECDATKV